MLSSFSFLVDFYPGLSAWQDGSITLMKMERKYIPMHFPGSIANYAHRFQAIQDLARYCTRFVPFFFTGYSYTWWTRKKSTSRFNAFWALSTSMPKILGRCRGKVSLEWSRKILWPPYHKPKWYSNYARNHINFSATLHFLLHRICPPPLPGRRWNNRFLPKSRAAWAAIKITMPGKARRYTIL